MKVALIHYWLVTMRGGEKVLEALCELFPGADIFTHSHDPGSISSTINAHDIKTTFIGSLPFSNRLYKSYLPLMPLALEQLDLRDYDLIISSESGPAKGVVAPASAVHHELSAASAGRYADTKSVQFLTGTLCRSDESSTLRRRRR